MLDNIIFLKIETVPVYESYKKLPHGLKVLWDQKFECLDVSDDKPAEAYQKKAGLYAEFGKIVVIGLGYFKNTAGRQVFRMTALQNDNEKELLNQFKQLLLDKFAHYRYRFCAHNGKGFEYPYLSRRMTINQIDLPIHLDVTGKRPWEIKHLDTLELWRFGDYKHSVSLDLLCNILNIPCNNNDLNGEILAHKYYKERGLKEISEYCLGEVLVTARVYQSITFHPLVVDEDTLVLELI
jgi:DNA polymerase elongation subunit (family B)